MEQLNIRKVETSDIPTIESWWTTYRKDDFEVRALSSTGVIIENKAVGFFYGTTDSKRCFADFIIANPAIAKEDRAAAIDIIMDSLITIGRLRGYEVMEITVRNRSILNKCLNKGFINLGELSYLGKEL